MSQNSKGTRILLFSIVLLGSAVAFTASVSDRTQGNVLPQSKEEVRQESQLLSVTLEARGERYRLEAAPGSTAYDLLVQAQETTEFTFSGREFAGLGFYVDTVNGKREGSGRYWIYYINSRKAQLGVSWYQLNNHDTITFKLEDEE